jgi:hypothetical protein
MFSEALAGLRALSQRKTTASGNGFAYNFSFEALTSTLADWVASVALSRS